MKKQSLGDNGTALGLQSVQTHSLFGDFKGDPFSPPQFGGGEGEGNQCMGELEGRPLMRGKD